MFKKMILKKLESWGKAKRELPSQNDAMKMKILSQMPRNFSREIKQRRGILFWTPVAFSTLAVLAIIINSANFNTFRLGSQKGAGTLAPEYYTTSPMLDYDRNPSIADSREFLKIRYNGSLETRDVKDSALRIEETIRSTGGRVDHLDSGEKTSYIRFVMSKTSFDLFKLKIRDFAISDRFYKESIFMENLLPEKQRIEESQKTVEERLNELKNNRNALKASHSEKISSYQKIIASLKGEISELNNEFNLASPERKGEIMKKIGEISHEITKLETEIAKKNLNYQNEMSSINSQVRITEENLKSVKNQDDKFVENIATVEGTVRINWISLWDIGEEYAPGPLIAWIFILVALVSFIWRRYYTTDPYLY